MKKISLSGDVTCRVPSWGLGSWNLVASREGDRLVLNWVAKDGRVLADQTIRVPAQGALVVDVPNLNQVRNGAKASAVTEEQAARIDACKGIDQVKVVRVTPSNLPSYDEASLAAIKEHVSVSCGEVQTRYSYRRYEYRELVEGLTAKDAVIRVQNPGSYGPGLVWRTLYVRRGALDAALAALGA